MDLIIAASSAPPKLYPAIACQIQDRLGIPNHVPAFDITAACSGLIYGLSIAKAYISSGMYKTILIVATDNNSRLLDWEDRSTSILFGDGAGAMVVTESDDGVDDIIAIDIKADGTLGNLIELPLSGQNCPLVEPCENHKQYIVMNGKEVYKFVVQTMPESIMKCLEDAELEPKDVDYLVPHQANLRIIEGLQNRLEFSDDKVIVNIDRYGNTSAASVPIALAEGIQSGKIKTPAVAILCAFGAGMAWGSAVVRLREGLK